MTNRGELVNKIFALLRVKRALLVAVFAFVALPAASALATTIGQSGGDIECNPVGGSVIGDTNYVVPSGGGVITSFSFQSKPENAGNQIDFLVLRPAGPSSYTVVGKTGVKTLAGTGLETFSPPSSIAVQGGDILGFWVISPPGETSFQNCLRFTGSGGGAIGSDQNTADPNTGDTVRLPVSDSLTDVNESANLVVLPTSKAQCKHGGWKDFSGIFKNQGDCVAFVASGDKNPPGG
jgi:hypothetical protein